jgi:hypothetical protein
MAETDAGDQAELRWPRASAPSTLLLLLRSAKRLQKVSSDPVEHSKRK